jgi:XTP/dITP diphosphohydrolase
MHPPTLETLLIATTNAGKAREIGRLLAGLPVTLKTLADVPPLDEPDESGQTFAENAVIKARAYADWTGLPTVAEDSGLVIDALGGQPGVQSARYRGTTYPEKFVNLYRELAPYGRPWTARYVCSLAVVDRERTLFATEATVEGEIAPVPRGTHGFGYDPIFYFPAYGRTFGDTEDADKLAVAHRGKAFRALAAWLRAGWPTVTRPPCQSR